MTQRTDILTPEFHQHIIGSPDVVRAAVMAPTDRDGQVDISHRWFSSFEDEGLDVVIIPVGAPNMDALLPHLDVLLLPGGDSNVHPLHYNKHYRATHALYDYNRDVFAFELLKRSYDLDMPTLGICRGMQEMIVAFGGEIEHLDTEIDHAQGYKNSKLPNGLRCEQKMDLPVHDFHIQNGGILEKIYGAKKVQVNSIHMEGLTLDTLNRPENAILKEIYNVEALAPDGVVEAISAIGKRFFLGFQPHAEMKGTLHDALYSHLFSEIYQYHEQRTQGHKTHHAEPSYVHE